MNSVSRWVLFRFQFGDLGFQRLEAGASAGQYHHLTVEFLPADQFKALLQSGFSKLDLVSREEFDSQMVVLARTRARLESMEAKVAEMEAKLLPPAQ